MTSRIDAIEPALCKLFCFFLSPEPHTPSSIKTTLGFSFPFFFSICRTAIWIFLCYILFFFGLFFFCFHEAKNFIKSEKGLLRTWEKLMPGWSVQENIRASLYFVFLPMGKNAFLKSVKNCVLIKDFFYICTRFNLGWRCLTKDMRHS